MVAVQPRGAEGAHRVDDREERLALFGELVLDARRRLGVAVPYDDALLLDNTNLTEKEQFQKAMKWAQERKGVVNS